MVDSVSRDSAELHVRMLGPPTVTLSDAPLTVPRRQARALLYYLAHDLQPAPRERLTLLFWSDVASSTARRNLSRLLSYLRQALPVDNVIEARGGTIALNTELVWSDCVAFEQLRATDHESAVELYRGPFLDGFAPDYGPMSTPIRDGFTRTFREKGQFRSAPAFQVHGAAAGRSWRVHTWNA